MGAGSPFRRVAFRRLAFRVSMRLRRDLSRCRAQTKRRHNIELARGVRCGPNVRLMAEPGGRITIGEGVEIGSGSVIVALADGHLVIGRGVSIAHGCTIAAYARVVIGDDVMVAEYVSIRDHDHDPALPPKTGSMLVDPVDIGAEVWIGAKVSILRGASVGARSVVGAHAVVTRRFPNEVLVAGVPAKIMRSL